MWLTLMIACTLQASEPRPKATGPRSVAADGLWDHWGDGKAELASYRLKQPRYGDARQGEAVLITVTEQFTRKGMVKSDGGHGDEFAVIKLNDTRDFQTGVYDYHAMTSTFVPLDGSAARGQPAKIAFSMQEWCGTTWEQVVVRAGVAERVLHSYFDRERDQEDQTAVPPGGIYADAMPVLVRGLAGELLAPGETRAVPWFERLLDRRMNHLDGGWGRATLHRSATPAAVEVPAGSMDAWTWTAKTPSGTWTWWVEAEAPHRLLGWHNSSGEHGELMATTRQPYWNQAGTGEERRRADLALPARVWP